MSFVTDRQRGDTEDHRANDPVSSCSLRARVVSCRRPSVSESFGFVAGQWQLACRLLEHMRRGPNRPGTAPYVATMVRERILAPENPALKRLSSNMAIQIYEH
jgi:hypothetical protein